MEIRTQEDFERAERVFTEIQYFWLGGSDVQEEGVWKWDSNDERINMDQFWLGSEPEGGDLSDCLVFSVTDNDSGLADISCGSSYKFICE